MNFKILSYGDDKSVLTYITFLPRFSHEGTVCVIDVVVDISTSLARIGSHEESSVGTVTRKVRAWVPIGPSSRPVLCTISSLALSLPHGREHRRWAPGKTDCFTHYLVIRCDLQSPDSKGGSRKSVSSPQNTHRSVPLISPTRGVTG